VIRPACCISQIGGGDKASPRGASAGDWPAFALLDKPIAVGHANPLGATLSNLFGAKIDNLTPWQHAIVALAFELCPSTLAAVSSSNSTALMAVVSVVPRHQV
jgi:hypothetical protein